jgi:phosphohistidine phosphatase
MDLYLMRHAEAEKMGAEILTDRERPLTTLGRFQAETIAQELKRRRISPLIVASPYRRTVQTAEILSEVLSAESFRQEPLLASAGHAPDLTTILQRYVKVESLLLIGHQPDLGLLAAQFLGFEFGFGTATIAAFKSDPANGWRFLWTASPENLFRK